MKSYILTSPEGMTDQQYARANPAQETNVLSVPGVVCDVCGQTWSWGRGLYLPVSSPKLARKLNGWPLPVAQWLKLAEEVRRELQLPETFVLYPGDQLGTPTYKITAKKVPDFIHPYSSGILVTKDVRQVILDNHWRGAEPIPVILQFSKRIAAPKPEEVIEPLELWLLKITANVNSSTSRKVILCERCGRFEYHRTLHDDSPDTTGVDFFHVYENPYVVAVTEEVCKVLTAHQFTNFVCVDNLKRY